MLGGRGEQTRVPPVLVLNLLDSGEFPLAPRPLLDAAAVRPPLKGHGVGRKLPAAGPPDLVATAADHRPALHLPGIRP
jgi:hypothetical protein